MKANAAVPASAHNEPSRTRTNASSLDACEELQTHSSAVKKDQAQNTCHDVQRSPKHKLQLTHPKARDGQQQEQELSN